MEEEKKEELETKVVEETPVEEESEVVEPVDEGITRTLQVTFESFKEYYGNGGLKDQLKTAAIYSALLCVILYIFRGDKETAYVLLLMGIAVVSLFAFQILMFFITKFIIMPRQFKKNDINKMGIQITINNQGITQVYNGHDYKLEWSKISLVKETNDSFLLYANRQTGMVFSKTMFSEEDNSYIRGIATEKVFQYKDERVEIK